MSSSPGQVWASSIRRLQFEPRGWQLLFRDRLRIALRGLSARPGAALYAEYDTPDSEPADLENVLLYNLGMATFTRLRPVGVTCRRGRSVDHLHHVRYRLTDRAPDPGSGPAIAHVTADLGAAVPVSVGQWWTRLRPHLQTADTLLTTGEFTVDAVVRGPHATARIFGMIKPMLDGWISALHHHNGTDRDALLPRLVTLGAPSAVWAHLVDPTHAVLGPRRLMWPRGTGLAWNPADDRCRAFRIHAHHADRWSLDGTIRAVGS